MKNNILLVGAGYMAIEYAKVLKAMKLSFVVVGRGEKSSQYFKESTGMDAVSGGIDKWLREQKTVPAIVIIAVSVDQLADAAKKLISHGVKLILLEKPGGLTPAEIESVAKLSDSKKAKVYIAYNRRFYASTERAIKLIGRDGGVKSFTFDFTEWSHQIVRLNISPAIKKNWFLANSSHVIDLAFFLGGEPRKINSYKSGTLKWHPAGSVFSGAGVTSSGALFSYSANWVAPGRWGVEIMTSKSRLIFRPLERLQIQKIGSLAIEEVKIDDRLDKKFKPGLYRQVKAILSDQNNLLTINKQVKNLEYYNKIINGSKKTPSN